MNRTLLLAAPLAAALLACKGTPEHPATATAPAPSPPGEVHLDQVPDVVRVEEVAASDGSAAVLATGRVTFDEEAVSRVAAPVSGRVVELLVHPGDRVAAGQPLLAIASPDSESAVADWVSALADEEEADRALERERRLFADGAAAKKDVLEAESDAVKAQAALTRAKGRLSVLGIDPAKKGNALARFVLRSPLGGVVVERPAFTGMEVRADSGTPLVTVANLDHLWVVADVYERDLGRVAKGQKASIEVAAWRDRSFPGVVTYVGDLVDPQTRTVKLRIEVTNSKRELKPEMFARVTLAGLPAHAALITVPSTAVLSDGDAAAVIVDAGNGRYQKRVVESGPESDGRVRVLAGLRAAERVVVEGALYLKAAIEGT